MVSIEYVEKIYTLLDDNSTYKKRRKVSQHRKLEYLRRNKKDPTEYKEQKETDEPFIRNLHTLTMRGCQRYTN